MQAGGICWAAASSCDHTDFHNTIPPTTCLAMLPDHSCWLVVPDSVSLPAVLKIRYTLLYQCSVCGSLSSVMCSMVLCNQLQVLVVCLAYLPKLPSSRFALTCMFIVLSRWLLVTVMFGIFSLFSYWRFRYQSFSSEDFSVLFAWLHLLPSIPQRIFFKAFLRSH